MSYKNLSYFKKIKLFFFFRKVIKENRNTLQNTYGIRVDKASRLYTVLNIPETIIGEAYTLKSSDINRISESYTKEFSRELGTYLNGLGLGELYEFYKIERVDKFSWLLVIGFSLFISTEFYNKLFWRWIPISLGLIITLLLIFI